LFIFNILVQPEKNYLEKEAEVIKEKMNSNLNKEVCKNDALFLKQFLRNKIPSLVRYFKENTNKTNSEKHQGSQEKHQKEPENSDKENKENTMCNIEQLTNTIKVFNIPVKYTNSLLLNTLFQCSKDNESQDKINYQRFIKNIIINSNENENENAKISDFKEVIIIYNISNM